MQQQVSPGRLAVAFVGLLVLAAVGSAQTSTPCTFTAVRACVHLHDDSQLLPTTLTLSGRLPVLFVHGHNTDSANDADFNYQKNWQDTTRVSFKPTLGLNPALDIEDYYIRFEDQSHSISEDATDISDAIDLILHRHDPNYAYPHVSGQTSHVKVVIVAYSKGTLSARLYLKSLVTNIVGMPPPRPGFNPVSEFIAISPPNHGIVSLGTTCAAQELMNGRTAFGCNVFGVLAQPCGSFPAGGLDFITNLNTPDEAPGSRAPTNSSGAPTPPTQGTLFVTIFADASNPDLVGGASPPNPNPCMNRPMAANQSSNAVNIQLPIAGADAAEVHGNTPHTPLVICKALYAAVHHRSPVAEDCSLPANATDPPVVPPAARAAAMLSLDFSGSMSALTEPGGPTRALALKDAVELFVQLWTAVSVPSDCIGVNYFSTNVTRVPATGVELRPLSTGGPAIIADLPNQSPGGLTAMGGGLQRAIEALDGVAADTPIRRVILFTDGMQNVNPMVQTVGNQLVIDNQTGRPNSNVPTPSPTPRILDASLGIAVDTIGIGASPAFVGLLQDISADTGGRSWPTNDPAFDLRRFFVESLINALKGFSPQLVAYRRGAVAANKSTEAFAIEDGVRKLVLKLSWKRGAALDFSVAKDGVDVTSAGHFIEGAFYKIFVIDLPAKGARPITARGNWQLRIKGKAPTGYEAAAIVDGGRMRYDAVFEVKRPRVGNPLDLVVRVTAGGRPIDRSARVTVTLMRPATAVNDILAKIPRKELTAFEPGMTLAEQRLLVLAQDPKRWAALKPRQQKLELRPNDKGEFRTRFRPRVAGIYTAFVSIEGEADKIGKFSRAVTAITVVRSAK